MLISYSVFISFTLELFQQPLNFSKIAPYFYKKFFMGIYHYIWKQQYLNAFNDPLYLH